ncbi:MAG: hypothetical protein H3C30_02190 [Candidatus Hydrogenedentes bacterium]|nr:hypothetical protein [Candidatus Hydrogenedentota bacterium]
MADMNSVDTVPGKNRQGVEVRRLIRDFIMRTSAAIAYGMVCAAIFVLCGLFPFGAVITIFGPLLVARDGITGTIKCLRTLPVSQKTLGRTLWLEGVILFPLFCIVFSPLVLLPSHFANEPSGMDWSLLPLSLLGTFIFMGCCGAVMLFVSFIISGNWGTGKTGGFFPVLLGTCWLLFYLERSYHQYGESAKGFVINGPGDFAVLAGVPVMIALSYFRYAGMTFGGPASTKKASGSARPAYTRSRLGAWAGFWVMQLFYVLAMMLMFAAVYFLMQFLTGEKWPGKSRMEDYVRMAILFSPLMTLVWFNSLRALRPLPMTSLRLTLFLLAIPTVAVGIMTATLTAVFMGLGDSVMARLCLTAGLTVLSPSYFVCACIARYGQNAAVLMAVVSLFVLVAWLNVLSLIFIVGAFFFLWHTIKSSSRAYKHKPVNPFR